MPPQTTPVSPNLVNPPSPPQARWRVQHLRIGYYLISLIYSVRLRARRDKALRGMPPTLDSLSLAFVQLCQYAQRAVQTLGKTRLHCRH